MMKGKKTYATAAIAIVTALATMYTGDMSTAEGIQTIFGAIMAATVRNGIK